MEEEGRSSLKQLYLKRSALFGDVGEMHDVAEEDGHTVKMLGSRTLPPNQLFGNNTRGKEDNSVNSALTLSGTAAWLQHQRER